MMLHPLDFSPGPTVDSQCFILSFVALMWSNIGQQSAKVSDPVRLFSLLSLGEIGRHTYVSLKDFILFTYLFIFSFQENNLILFHLLPKDFVINK